VEVLLNMEINYYLPITPSPSLSIPLNTRSRLSLSLFE